MSVRSAITDFSGTPSPSDRSFQIIRVGEHVTQFDVMIYRGKRSMRQPLLILHSIEFPMPPSAEFCEQMWANGLQVIFVRRAGFGRSSPLPAALITDAAIKNGATAAAEAVMLRQLIVKLDLNQIILLAMGSVNPVVCRLLKMAPEIEFSILANPVFNQDIWQVFSPLWFQKMLKQVITSKSGLHVASQGMKLLIRKDPISFFKHILQKNPGDIAYVEANRADYDAAGEIALNTGASQLYYDALMCLEQDPLLRDDFFDRMNVTILIGEHSTDYWQTEMQKEAARLNLTIHYAPQGDIFGAFASPETVLEMISARSDQFASVNKQ